MERASNFFKDNVREWYIKSFPGDNFEYAYIPKTLTFGDLAGAVISTHKTAAEKKIVRFMYLSNTLQEKILGEIANRLNVSYKSVLNEIFLMNDL